MIAFARHACLVVLVAAAGLGCASTQTAPRTAAVLIEPRSAQAGVARAFERRGIAVATLPEGGQAPTDALAQARRSLARAIDAQQSFREGEAVEALAHAEQLASAGGVDAASRRLLADAGLLRAWLHLSAGRTADAEREASRALMFTDPGAPDPAAYPPELIELFARVSRAPSPTGTLRIAVRGSEQAQVWIDGRALGVAPVDAGGIAAGRHYVRIEAAGFEVIADRVEVPASAEVARSYTLGVAPPAALADAARSTTGAARRGAARRLATALELDGVAVGRALVDGSGVRIVADWIPRDGPARRVQGQGPSHGRAADDLARQLAPPPASTASTASPSGSSALGPVLWIAGGAVVATLAVGAAVLLSGGENDEPGARVRCCELR